MAEWAPLLGGCATDVVEETWAAGDFLEPGPPDLRRVDGIDPSLWNDGQAVLVQIGKWQSGCPSCVHTCVAQWRLFNPTPSSQVFLICDEHNRKNCEAAAVEGGPGVFVVAAEPLMTPDAASSEKVFWWRERFFLVQALMEQRQLRHVLHLEADTLVYVNVAHVALPAMACGVDLAVAPSGVDWWAPGVTYIADAAALKRMLNFWQPFLCGETDITLSNDMMAIAEFFYHAGPSSAPPRGRRANRRGVSMLPIWPHKPGTNCLYDAHRKIFGSALVWDASKFGVTASHGDFLLEVWLNQRWNTLHSLIEQPPLLKRETMVFVNATNTNAGPPLTVPRVFGGAAFLGNLHLNFKGHVSKFRSDRAASDAPQYGPGGHHGLVSGALLRKTLGFPCPVNVTEHTPCSSDFQMKLQHSLQRPHNPGVSPDYAALVAKERSCDVLRSCVHSVHEKPTD